MAVLKYWDGAQWVVVGGPLQDRSVATFDTTGRNALTGDALWDGRTIWNSSTKRLEAYSFSTSTWVPVEMDLPLRIERTSKDANGIFTVISWYRADSTLARRSTLSGGTSPTYTTRTVVDYASNGTTVVRTTAYTLTYDGDSDITIEALT